jgi:large conductance mechanosensitive channel
MANDQRAHGTTVEKGGFINEFKAFILRGNVVDMAVGIIIGAAFTSIVTSLVRDLVMPLIGIATGGVDLTSLSTTVGSATFAWGTFVQSVINFLLVALVVFLMVKGINKLHRKDEKTHAPEKPSDEVVILTQIRDLLGKGTR